MALFGTPEQGLAEVYGLEKTLYTFDERVWLSNNDGAYPRAPLIQGDDGFLYGTAPYGGPNKAGTIFRVGTDGAFTVLHAFDAYYGGDDSWNENYANEGGVRPIAGLVQAADGTFWGVTQLGGPGATGTVFSLSPAGGFRIYHSFPAVNEGGANSEGAYPEGTLVIGPDGAYYGTTAGGGLHGSGTVFKIAADGTFEVLHAFGSRNSNGVNADGAEPHAGLVLADDGHFYGVTHSGGSYGGGTLFRMAPAGAYTVLHTVNPYIQYGFAWGPLIQATDGNLYGTDDYGVFRFTLDGELSFIHAYCEEYCFEGLIPSGPLVQATDGFLYGATAGSIGGAGTVYRVSLDGTSYSLLYSFGVVRPDGWAPYGGVVQADDGHFYGTTQISESLNWQLHTSATVFQLRLTDTAPVTTYLDPDTIIFGDTYVLHWTSVNATRCYDSAGNTLEPSGSKTSLSPGLMQRQYPKHFGCVGPEGNATTYKVLTVNHPPPTLDFGVWPATISLGATAKLTWSVSWAPTCTASGDWSGEKLYSGDQSVEPMAQGSYSYTLTCEGQGGTAQETVSLSVGAPAPTLSLSATQTKAVKGSSVLVEWAATGVSTCTASGAWTGSQPLQGFEVVDTTSAGTRLYRLTCTGAGGQVNVAKSVSIEIFSPGAAGGAFSSWLLLLGFAPLIRRKFWYRVPEAARAARTNQDGDDNPDITDYLGYGS